MVNLFFLKRVLDKIARIKYVNRWVVFTADLGISFISSLIASSFVFFVMESGLTRERLTQLILLSVACSAVSFVMFRSYKRIIRHSTFIESGLFGTVSFIKVLLESIILAYFLPILSPREIMFFAAIDGFVTFFLLVTSRVMLIIVYRYIKDNSGQEKQNLLIFGTGNRTASMLNGSIHNSFRNIKGVYRIMGCLIFDRHQGYRLSGYRIYKIETQEDFNELVTRLRIKAILFPDYKIVKEESERLVRFCEKKKIRMFTLPSVDEVKDGKPNLLALPEVRIEDLLGRSEIKINMKEIAQELKGQVVLVTGAARSIGSELCRQLCTFGLKQLVLFDSAETPMYNIRLELEEKFPDVEFTPVMGDVRMPARVESIFTRFKPHIVFHAAAYKHVPLMEDNPCEAVQTNVFGTRTVADLSVKYKVSKFIMVSIDKAVNPTNVMGASKRLAEIYVQSLSMAIQNGKKEGETRFITTRFGNVPGSNGSVIPRFREQIKKGGPITVTHPEIIRYFMTIPEACRLVLEAAFMGKGNEIFVFDMGTPVKIVDLARRMIELGGLIPGEDIEIKYTGLRPGEKLYEELLATKENTPPTLNEKIFRAQVREYDYEEVADSITQLSQIALCVDRVGTVRMMKQLVPEYVSQHSEFENLDKEKESVSDKNLLTTNY